MSPLTSKDPDSKLDFIRDPSCDGPVHLNLTSKVPDSNLISSEIRLVLSRHMLNLTSKVPDSKPDFIRDPSCIEPEIRLVLSQVHVKSDVEGSRFETISSEIRLVLSQVHVKSDVEGSRLNTDFIRDPSCVEPGACKSDVEGSDSKT
ncbi:hypothetical protein AVEN_207266-1 [Araneus ventricosus]|uniref:Uncharacterized protein n=1 Tax=Araneus ventricosus TaxID=182803 RepID=A0A4Y2ICU3_ARAVE|nr:hypothetical protein AVEN_207266-1 [Araneus ventricosus]